MSKRKTAVRDVETKLCLMRCFEECMNAIIKSKPLPKAIAYETLEIKYIIDPDFQLFNIYIIDELVDDFNDYEIKLNNLKKLNNSDRYIINSKNVLSIKSNSIIEINNLGNWIQVVSVTVSIRLFISSIEIFIILLIYFT